MHCSCERWSNLGISTFMKGYLYTLWALIIFQNYPGLSWVLPEPSVTNHHHPEICTIYFLFAMNNFEPSHLKQYWICRICIALLSLPSVRFGFTSGSCLLYSAEICVSICRLQFYETKVKLSHVISPLLKRCRSLVVKPKIEFAQRENQCLSCYQTMISRLWVKLTMWICVEEV